MKAGLIALVVAALGAIASPAAAATRVAVAPFEGDRTGDLQDIVIELLEADYRVLPTRDVTRAMDKLGIDDFDNNKALAKLAAQLDADAVIVGGIENDGNKTKLTMRVYVVAKKSAFKMTARYNTPKQVKESALKEELRNALGDSDEGPGRKGKRSLRRDGDDDDDDDRGRKGKRKGKRSLDDGDDDRSRDDDDDRASDDDDDDRKGKRKGKRTSRRDGDDDLDEDADLEDSADEPVVARSARKAGLRVEVGVSGTGRQLTFNSNLDMDQAPPGYKSNLVPGARVHAEIYPLALQDPDSAAAGFGIVADFDRAIGLTTTSSLALDSPLTTTSQFWSVGLRYRIAIGNRAMSPSFTLGVGYGVRKFTIDRGPLEGGTLDLPDVVYKYIDPTVTARIPIHPSSAFTVGGRFLAMRDTGPIGKNDQYGQAKVTGIDLEAGLEFLLGKYVLIHIAGVFTQLGYTFNGGAVETNGRDGNMDTIDVGGARDRYYGAMGTLGVVY
jgi:hypothetical protein